MIDAYFEEKILDKFAIPHVFFPQDTIQQKRVLAWHITSLKGAELLLTTSFSFSYPAIIAGISENNIDYIAKNAPKKYKTELLEAIKKDHVQKDIIEIARVMDEDLGENVTKNQTRIRNVIQYIKDNCVVFEF